MMWGGGVATAAMRRHGSMIESLSVAMADDGRQLGPLRDDHPRRFLRSRSISGNPVQVAADASALPA